MVAECREPFLESLTHCYRAFSVLAKPRLDGLEPGIRFSIRFRLGPSLYRQMKGRFRQRTGRNSIAQSWLFGTGRAARQPRTHADR